MPPNLLDILEVEGHPPENKIAWMAAQLWSSRQDMIAAAAPATKTQVAVFPKKRREFFYSHRVSLCSECGGENRGRAAAQRSSPRRHMRLDPRMTAGFAMWGGLSNRRAALAPAKAIKKARACIATQAYPRIIARAAG
jgi:hypothetical protein